MNKILQGDTLEVLKTLPDESVDMVITSPPYWALRDYGIAGQIGQEPTFQEYIEKLIRIFNEAKRVLKKEGTCWVNLGDSYDAKNKSLLQIPSRFSIVMTNSGWILRNEIIWHKPNAMPSSVKDRFTVDFEKLFFFTKGRKYYFEMQYEPSLSPGSVHVSKNRGKSHKIAETVNNTYMTRNYTTPDKRSRRAVWSINTKPFPEAHFAVFPEALIETPIKAGCPEGGIVLDPFMGSGTTAVVAKRLGRNYLGIELNPEYIKIAEKRINSN